MKLLRLLLADGNLILIILKQVLPDFDNQVPVSPDQQY